MVDLKTKGVSSDFSMMKSIAAPSLRNQKKQLLNFHKILYASYKMETQKIINGAAMLFIIEKSEETPFKQRRMIQATKNDSSNEESKFATKNGIL